MKKSFIGLCAVAAALAMLTACDPDRMSPETAGEKEEQDQGQDEGKEQDTRTNYAEFTIGDKVIPIVASDIYDWSGVDNCLEMWLYSDPGKNQEKDYFFGSVASFVGEFDYDHTVPGYVHSGNWFDYNCEETYMEGSNRTYRWGSFWDSACHKVTAIDLNTCSISAECEWKLFDAKDAYENHRTKDERIIVDGKGVFVDYHFTFSQH